MSTTVEETHHDTHHDHKPSGIGRWLFTTNHKDIGSMYLWFSFIMFLTGGAMAMVIRAELFQPGLQLVEPHFFNLIGLVIYGGWWPCLRLDILCTAFNHLQLGLNRVVRVLNTHYGYFIHHGCH